MKKRRILITGAAGFIGYHVIKSLSLFGVELVGIDNLNDYYDVDLKIKRLRDTGIEANSSERSHKHYKSTTLPNYTFFKGDIRDIRFLEEVVFKNSITDIIHLAAQAGVRYSILNPMEYFSCNIEGFMNVLEASRKFNVEKLLYASSSSVYGETEIVPFREEDVGYNPESFYAATKMCNEIMAKSYSKIYKLRTVGLRFFTVYGPFGRPDMAPFIFSNAIVNNKSIDIYNDGNMERDFTYVDDIVSRLIKLVYAEIDEYYSVFNVGNGKSVNLNKFVSLLEREFGKVADKVYLPMQRGDVTVTWASSHKLNAVIGELEGTDLEVGIESFVKWFKDYYNV